MLGWFTNFDCSLEPEYFRSFWAANSQLYIFHYKHNIAAKHLNTSCEMGKKRQVDQMIINIEEKLDKNGALRNVAVKDAWQRMRQNIEVVRIRYFSNSFVVSNFRVRL